METPKTLKTAEQLLKPQRSCFADPKAAETTPWIVPLGGSSGYLVTKEAEYSTHFFPPYLRSFSNPACGPRETRQSIHIEDYKKLTEDRGGVHRNAEITSFAYHTATILAGGPPWE
ncbi:hypothetical protein BT63DRAFT_457435 [Microthyrium microscopicum]|uniref:Uncharacterized protein n=1 Tax=Microthyrium microscopicum TaxID=703497 RepID=A0A6A6U6B2_9PEZI|nr:hypothetical protein BT63DRAFT_457435 [Microthyrium microscopicum]